MRYQSTRGGEQGRDYKHVVLKGLADDGGLFVPEHIPNVSEQLRAWRGLPFSELSAQILSLYTGDSVPLDDLRELTHASYATFDTDAVVPVHTLEGVGASPPLHVVELFHGPTFSFKDVALQMLGAMFSYLLRGEEHGLTVLGATSGDTGSAALYGCRGKSNIDVFILHPKGRVSEVQERQMTTLLDDNIHNIAVEGSFDECQAMVKAAFNDLDFKRRNHLAAINSINWGRIACQIVYYFHTYFTVVSEADHGKEVVFAVPTGNFGNVLAGFYAKQMGLPIRKLVVCTNQNDILHRFFAAGDYTPAEVAFTHSPAMDIQLASNFERFLFFLADNNAEQTATWMRVVKSGGRVQFDRALLARARSHMASFASSPSDTLATMADIARERGYTLCPHSAIGVRGALAHYDALARPDALPMLCMATAHPGKFGDAVQLATGAQPTLPPALAALAELPTRVLELPVDVERVKSTVVQLTGPHTHVAVRAPASTANLACGYDALGAALQKHLHVVVDVCDAGGLTVRMEGVGCGDVPLDGSNLIWRAAQHTAAQHGGTLPSHAHATVHNAVPLARGLGSSSAAIVAGVMVANALCGLKLSRDTMLRACVEVEGHPDNVCASLMGGAMASVSGNNATLCTRVPVHASLQWVVAVPDMRLSTEDARAAVPASQPTADAVFNVQRAAALVLSLGTANVPLLREALRDALHQPHRAPLVPGFAAMLALRMDGLVGVCLSGAGPSVLALATHNTQAIGDALVRCFAEHSVTARAETLPIDTAGAVYAEK